VEDLNGQIDRLVTHLVRQGVTLAQARRSFERQFVLAALRQNDGNISRSASHIGLHRNTLRNKVAALRIRAADYRRLRTKTP